MRLKVRKVFCKLKFSFLAGISIHNDSLVGQVYLLIHYRVTSSEMLADIELQVLKVFDEPLGESNTKVRVKILASISKKGTLKNIYYQIIELCY